MLTGGEVAALIVAIFWAVLVIFISFVLLRLARVLTETTKLVAGITERTVPLLEEVTTTVTLVDGQLERVDAITRNVESVTDNASRLATLVTATIGGPMARVAGLTYAVRKAFSGRERSATRRRVKAEITEARRGRKRARRKAGGLGGRAG